MGGAPGPSVENILKNITPSNPVYQVVMKDMWEKVAASIKDVPREAVEQLAPLGAPLAADSYFLMYSFYPLLKSEEEIANPVLRELRKAFEDFMNTEEYKKARRVTRLNRPLSEVFGLRFGAALIQKLYEKLKDKLQELAAAMQAGPRAGIPAPAGGAGEKRGRRGRGARRGGGGYSRKRGRAQHQAPGPAPGAPQHQPQQGGGLPREVAEALREAVMEAAHEAARAAERAHSIMGSLSKGTSPAELAFLDEELGIPDVELDVMFKVLGELRKSMPIMFRKLKKRSPQGMPHGYTLTRNPARALPRELALPEELFLAKLARGGFTARERVSPRKGVMIVLLDRSGSMGGIKMGWAKAVALALAAKARREGLDFYLIPFDYAPHLPPLTLEDVKDIAAIQAGGGTDIASAINAALDLVEEKHYNKANIILITDGADESPQQYKNQLIDRAKRDHATIKVFFIEGANNALKEIAKATKGDLYTVKPQANEALKIIKIA